MRRAFTLTEVLVTMTIAGFVLTGVLAVFIQALKIYHYDRKKLTINRQIRDFTAELTTNATFANYALIFPDFFNRTQAVDAKNPDGDIIVRAGTPLQVADGQSGDMLVLVYVNPDNDTLIDKLVGYYRAPLDPNDPDSRGPVRKFDLSFSPASSNTVTNLLPPVSTYGSGDQVIELSEGLSDGRLFHNFYGRSVMVNGEIIQDEGAGSRMATNTYNFTISPRG